MNTERPSEDEENKNKLLEEIRQKGYQISSIMEYGAGLSGLLDADYLAAMVTLRAFFKQIGLRNRIVKIYCLLIEWVPFQGI